MNLKKITPGMAKQLAERFKANLAWFQLPLIFYSAVLGTVIYFPWLSGWIFEIFIAAFILLIIFAVVFIYIDYRYIYFSERNFLYKGISCFDDNFDEIKREVYLVKSMIEELKSNNKP